MSLSSTCIGMKGSKAEKNLKQTGYIVTPTEKLFYAIRQGSIETIRTLLAQGADVNARMVEVNVRTNDYVTPLGVATAKGSQEMVEILLRAGAKVDHQNEQGWNVLMLAVHDGYTKVAETLLAYTVDINAQNSIGSTALSLASRGYKDIVKLLLEAKADPNLTYKDTIGVTGWTALMNASQDGHKEIVEMLLDAGADVNAQNSVGLTALALAAGKKHKEIVKILLDANADPTIPFENRGHIKWTALLAAIEVGDKDCIEMLIDAGAQLDITVCNLRETLAQAVLKLYKQDKLPIKLVNFLIKNGYQGLVSALIQQGFTGEGKDDNDKTPLMQASLLGYSDLVQEFLAVKADVHVKDKEGMTALMHAARMGHVSIMKELILAGAHLEEKSKNGATAFMLAALKGRKEAVELLLQEKVQDTCGYSSLLDKYYPQGICNLCQQKKKLLVCTACKAARYCSTDCQKKDWKHHKPLCRKKCELDQNWQDLSNICNK